MSIALVITLIILGIICLILELLVVPGAIVGIIGFLMMVAGVVIAYMQLGTLVGNIVLILTVALFITGITLALRSKTWRKMTLKTAIDSKMNEVDEDKVKPGMEGVALSRLAPMGKGRFNGEIVEVSSSLGFIDENSEIVIIKIEGNKIIVKLKN